jgi:alpha-ketoglutarate-dependent taurine dioxygenase
MTSNLSSFNISDLAEIAGNKLLINVDVDAAGLNGWLEDNAQHINRLMLQNGALLLRGLTIAGSKKLARVLVSIFGEALLEYSYRSTPRTKMRGQVYTSSEYHPDETIFLHNENAYSNTWPMKIAFYCAKASQTGGATPIADSRKVYQAIPEAIRDEFAQKKLMYVRNYGEVDLPWTEVFQTTERQQVEQFCTDNRIEFEWVGSNNLRTRQWCTAICEHPDSGEKLWFNQAHLFHISSLTPDNRESLLSVYKLADVPRNVYFGDGEEIPFETLDIIRQAYLDNMIVFDWCEGDLMLLDNMLYSHGRKPYSGDRRVLVGMAKSHGR